jgi:hypothetical protein
VAELVVARALLRVGEDLVRLGDLLERLLGLLVAGVAVGVVLERELAVRLLDVVLGGALRQTEHVVVVALLRHESGPRLQALGSRNDRRRPSLMPEA